MTDAQSEIAREIAEQNKRKDQEDTPACPMCGSDKNVRVHGSHDFTCMNCKMDFDGIDDGDIAYGRPEKRMEREERRGKHFMKGTRRC
jgi:ribosomal protein L37AE/L43A